MVIEGQTVLFEAFHCREMVLGEGFRPVLYGPFLIGDDDQNVGSLAIFKQARDGHASATARCSGGGVSVSWWLEGFNSVIGK